MALSLKEFVVTNKGGTLVQDDQIRLNHDGDSLTLGLPQGYDKLTYHVFKRTKTTGVASILSPVTAAVGWVTLIDENRTLKSGQAIITNQESSGSDTDTTVSFVSAVTTGGETVKAQTDAAKAVSGSNDEKWRKWWSENWWIVAIVVVVAGIAIAWVLVQYFRRATPGAPLVQASVVPAPVGAIPAVVK